MAKISSIVKNNKRIKLSSKYFARVKLLKKMVSSDKSTYEEKQEALKKLQKVPRNALTVRVRSRCEITGRSRGVYQDFKLCRNKFRELALQGLIPGVTKASW